MANNNKANKTTKTTTNNKLTAKNAAIANLLSYHYGALILGILGGPKKVTIALATAITGALSGMPVAAPNSYAGLNASINNTVITPALLAAFTASQYGRWFGLQAVTWPTGFVPSQHTWANMQSTGKWVITINNAGSIAGLGYHLVNCAFTPNATNRVARALKRAGVYTSSTMVKTQKQAAGSVVNHGNVVYTHISRKNGPTKQRATCKVTTIANSQYQAVANAMLNNSAKAPTAGVMRYLLQL